MHGKPEGKGCPKLLGDAVTPEELWACTTCRLCEDRCPMLIEHVGRIVEMRRALCGDTNSCPEPVREVFDNIRASGNPWGSSSTRRVHDRTSVAKGDPDVLLWLGCFASFDERASRIAEALKKVLDGAGVDYALMEDEGCCGDPARRLGDEALYQEAAVKNVARFAKAGNPTVLTICPHCFNTFKNEYPRFGGEFEVVDHSTFLLGLIRENRIPLSNPGLGKATFHDPCYLGRYNDIYDEPRDVLGSIPGIEVVEMKKRSRNKSECCGSGGGRVWFDDQALRNSAAVRIDQALQTKCDGLITACPLCVRALDDALAHTSEDKKPVVLDVAELIARCMDERSRVETVEEERALRSPLG
jgi:Fe-S oxidoreductase